MILSMQPQPPTPPRPARALPWLDDQRSALLAEMGLPAWWLPRALLPRPAQPAPPQDGTVSQGEAVPLAAPAARPPAPMPVAAPPGPAAPRPHEPAAAARSTALDLPPSAPLPAPTAPNAPVDTLDWDALHAAIDACRACALGACRQRAVPGVGDRRPAWLIVGEAPGEEEDRQGEPFVGRAGQLLDRMLAALDLRRGQGVYIANVLKCRPPRNRNPLPEEIARCTPYLLRQIALLQPRIVVAMGRFAAHTLLAEGGCVAPEDVAHTPLGRLRGRVYTGRFGALQVPIVVSYHPAYLLRNPVDKGKAWADLCLAAQALDDAGSPPP